MSDFKINSSYRSYFSSFEIIFKVDIIPILPIKKLTFYNLFLPRASSKSQSRGLMGRHLPLLKAKSSGPPSDVEDLALVVF